MNALANAAKLQALNEYTRINIQTDIESASPYRLIQMLMEGALSRISMAKAYIKQKQIAKKGEAISSAILIIGGLRDSLDHDAGGELAGNLEDLYEYMTNRLLTANLENDIEALDEVRRLLLQVKVAWDGIGSTPEATQVMDKGNNQTVSNSTA